MPRRVPPAAPAALGEGGPPRRQPADAAKDQRLQGLSGQTLERLERYAALVKKWTGSINLVSQRDRAFIWPRHVLDSLRLLPLIDPGTVRGVDLGSGAGFPGLVIALAADIPFDLIEADQRKAAFLREAQRVTGAPVTVHCTRIEALSLPPVPLVTARALAPLTALLGHAHKLLLPEGMALFPKGLRADTELDEARREWRMQVRRYDDPAEPGSTILAITGLARV